LSIYYTFVLQFHFITQQFLLMGVQGMLLPSAQGRPTVATLLKLTFKGVSRKVFRSREGNGKTKTEKYTNEPLSICLWQV